jgi:hypothetical protein
MDIINYFVSEENFVVYYKRDGIVQMKFVDISNGHRVLANDDTFVKRLVKYYLLSTTSNILNEERDIFLNRIVMTSEELEQELCANHKMALGNKDAYIFSINRDISHVFQDKWIACSRERVNIYDVVESVKKAAAEVVKGLDGLSIDDFLQSLAVNALRKGLINKIFDKIPLNHRNYLKLEYIEKSLPYLYDDLLFSESVAELYIYDWVIELCA